MSDSLDPAARAALTATLREKVDRLVRHQNELADERARLLALQRRNDRDLADCRATARLFELEVEFPPQEREIVDRHNVERVIATARDYQVQTEMQLRAARSEIEHRRLVSEHARLEARRETEAEIERRRHVAGAQFIEGTAVSVTPKPAPAKRPSLADFLAEQLKIAGAAGGKAAPLRDLFERTYGEPIHEKTVGMTLYRMSKKNLVSRKGHTWFLAEQPQESSAENPGATTPGSVEEAI